MKVLITGGTGTIGRALAEQLGTAIIFSRNEKNQVEMQREFPNCEYILGDVRDYKAIKEAAKGVNKIYHLAAIKHIDICEKQPLEALKTNVFGTYNVIKAAKKNGCKVVFMSTDKAENPTSVYGATKLLAEIAIERAGFRAVRSGNIFGSSGSVIPFFIKKVREENIIPLTDGSMTRFWILAEDICMALIEGKRGAFMSFTMSSIAEAVKKLYGNSETRIIEVGKRAGEKIHETIYGDCSADNISPDYELIEMFKKWDSSLT